MENEKKRKNNETILIVTIIALLFIITSAFIAMIFKNNDKYLEVAKRTLPEMKELLLETSNSYYEYWNMAVSPRSKYVPANDVIDEIKKSNSYKIYKIKIDEELSKMYKDLKYLKKHSYSKNRELSNEIKEIVEKFEKEMEYEKNLELGTDTDSKDIYLKIQELQNKVNKE